MLVHPAKLSLPAVLSLFALIAALDAAPFSIPEPIMFPVPPESEWKEGAPFVLDLGRVGSKQRAQFELRIAPLDSDELLEAAFTSCSCIALEGADTWLGDRGPWVLRGHHEATWTDEQIIAEHQTITLKTNRRTLSLRSELTTAPTGSPQTHVLDQIDLLHAPERIRVRHSLPAASKILRVTPPAGWQGLDMRLDFDPVAGGLEWEFDRALAAEWMRASQADFPHTETVALQVLHTTGDAPEALTQLRVELSHPGFAQAIPAKLDFGVLGNGGHATRSLVVEHGSLCLLGVEGPANFKIRPAVLAETQPGRSAFEVTVGAESVPASAGGAEFLEAALRARLSDGTALRIPAFGILSAIKP